MVDQEKEEETTDKTQQHERKKERGVTPPPSKGIVLLIQYLLLYSVHLGYPRAEVKIGLAQQLRPSAGVGGVGGVLQHLPCINRSKTKT